MRDITHLLENLSNLDVVKLLLIKLSYVQNQWPLQGFLLRSPMQVLMDIEIEVFLNFLACIYYALCGNGHSLSLNSANLFILELLSFLLTCIPPFFGIFEEI